MLPIVKIGLLTTFAFLLSFVSTPLFTKIVYRYNFGKQVRDKTANTPIFTKLHKSKTGTPTMGGILIWGVAAILAGVIFLLSWAFPQSVFGDLNFLTRSQTWLPLTAMVASALVGLFDDYLNIKKIGPKGGGLSMMYKLGIYFAISVVGAYWFFFKLGWDMIHIPFYGNFEIGIWYIPIFIFIIVATSFSVNEIDGLDGLAGGTLLYSFIAFGAIAFRHGRFDLAAFCGVIVGALLSFLWFNIHPARFFMGDTGSMSLGVTLGIVVMLTNSILLLPIIGFLLVAESLSVIIQLTSKKLRNGKKVFLSAPIHHHFEAKGWSEPKIVMRFWIIAFMCAIVGLILALIDPTF
jgi:phospho-N-acetylmuramoyl-pentapeptide-transferase